MNKNTILAMLILGYVIFSVLLIYWIIVYLIPIFIALDYLNQDIIGYHTFLTIVIFGIFFNPTILILYSEVPLPDIFKKFYDRIRKDGKELPYELDYKDYKIIYKAFFPMGIINLMLGLLALVYYFGLNLSIFASYLLYPIHYFIICIIYISVGKYYQKKYRKLKEKIDQFPFD